MDVSDAVSPVSSSIKVFVKCDMPTGQTIESQLCQFVLDPSCEAAPWISRRRWTPARRPRIRRRRLRVAPVERRGAATGGGGAAGAGGGAGKAGAGLAAPRQVPARAAPRPVALASVQGLAATKTGGGAAGAGGAKTGGGGAGGGGAGAGGGKAGGGAAGGPERSEDASMLVTRSKQRSGFSLLEMIIALALGVVLLLRFTSR